MALEQLGYSSPEGCIAPGIHSMVTPSGGATRTLLDRDSGGIFLFDSAAGVVYTLPSPILGMEFDFFSTVTITSNSAKILTNAASVSLLGEVLTYTTATASPAGFAFNGSTHVACTMNGTTTGGVIGTWINVVAISATQWIIRGNIVGSGVIATPAATS